MRHLVPTSCQPFTSLFNSAYLYGGIRILSCACAGNNFTSEGTMLTDNFSCFYSYRLCSPPELPRSAPYSPPSSVSWSHRLVIQLDYFFTVCLSAGSPILQDDFLSLHMLRFILCAVTFCGFGKCMVSCVHHYRIIRALLCP